MGAGGRGTRKPFSGPCGYRQAPRDHDRTFPLCHPVASFLFRTSPPAAPVPSNLTGTCNKTAAALLSVQEPVETEAGGCHPRS